MTLLAFMGVLGLLAAEAPTADALRPLQVPVAAPVPAGAEEVRLGPVHGASPERLQAGASQGDVALSPSGELEVHLPGDRHPRPLVVAFTDGAAGGATFVPVAGATELPVVTDRPARVVVEVGDRRFGPVDSPGRTTVPIEVPPGVTRAWVQATDAAGETTRVEVDLNAPAAPRVAVAFDTGALGPGSVRRGVAAVATEAGAPDTDARLEARAARGDVTAAARLAPGVWWFEYRAPAWSSEDEVVLAWEGISLPETRLRLAGSRPLDGDHLLAGVGVGLTSNLDQVLAPRWATWARWERPVGLAALGVVLGAEALVWADRHRAELGGATRTLDRSLSALTLPLQGRVATHAWPLTVYVQGGPTFTWYHARTSSDFQAPDAATGFRTGYRVGLGASLAAGRGQVSLEVRAGSTRLDEGPLRGQIDGLGLVAAYEVHLARLGGGS